MRKFCGKAKFPHQEIRWNYGIFRSGGLQKAGLSNLCTPRMKNKQSQGMCYYYLLVKKKCLKFSYSTQNIAIFSRITSQLLYQTIIKNRHFFLLPNDHGSFDIFLKLFEVFNLLDTGRKLNVHKTFRRRPGRVLNVLCTFNLQLLSMGNQVWHEN